MAKKKQKILLIEDDAVLRGMCRDKLEKEGFQVFETGDAEEGLETAETEKPDLVLLDLILPESDGFDFIIQMKKKTRTKKIPIVVLSSLSHEADRREVLKQGVDEYLVKTQVGLSQIVATIKKHLLSS